MHGLIFWALEQYAENKMGKGGWNRLLHEARLEDRAYLMKAYPDEEALALVGAASKLSGIPAGTLLEDFGLFIAPQLISTYGMLIRPEWNLLDFLQHTEATIHAVVREKNPGASPPNLVSERSERQVVIRYRSQRRLCALAVGIMRGAAEHYKQRVQIEHPECLLRGDPECRLAITVIG